VVKSGSSDGGAGSDFDAELEGLVGEDDQVPTLQGYLAYKKPPPSWAV